MRQPHKLLSQDSRKFTQARGTTYTAVSAHAHNVTAHNQGGRNHQRAPWLEYLFARANVKSVQQQQGKKAGGGKPQLIKSIPFSQHYMI